MYFFNARLRRGIELVQGVCRSAARYEKPVIAFCGWLAATEEELRGLGLQAAYSINDPSEETGFQEMLKNTAANLERSARRLFTTHWPVPKAARRSR